MIFHLAATVRFDEKLLTAVSINIIGTKNMLDIAREMPHLKVSHRFAAASVSPSKRH
jgi:fatty acyl-CoA reductase